ncbi:WD40 repeat domain-containing serine/threonine-protein kinase [Pseudanabaena galeata UHCC 0370]|uniref:WD40 repeat domain-containing serine/threonine-protein kinase n=1 Tax=Pseudanabaena galeata UHCC 0370 TaxID=3110310 RepID=A0ABU5TDS5_9CYAN|nr:WD40 repeat domain-containing serine/threonine-protein kinase [Pseudanabaena galeata]MEA5476429.1 WD40 repeat domain-containing serine/threonine-protein kinase [Pseudanabaena galeata UHCC 0370]
MATSPTMGKAFGNLLGGRFRVVQTIADDTYGQTYLVEDTVAEEMPRWIAKSFCLINKTNLQLDWARSLFRNQVPKLQQLSDRSADFPKITTYFEQEEEFYIVEEAIDGIRLSDEISTGKLYSESELVQFLRQLLTSLHIAHSSNMVHGDICPRNLIRRKDRQGSYQGGNSSDQHFVLTNFAVLKGIYATAAQNGVVLGTPSYMPFEQALGHFTPSCDIYALGLTAIQLLTGLHPSQLVRREDLNLLDWQMGSAIHPELMLILNRMVKHHPEDRYQTAQEVLYELDNLPMQQGSDDFQMPTFTLNQNTNRWAIALVCLAGISWGAIHFSQYLPKFSSTPKPTPTVTVPTPTITSNYQLRLSLTGHKGWVRAVAFFPNGFSFASGSYDRTLRLWNVRDNQSFGTLSNHLGSVSGINAIAVHPNGNTFAIACIDKSIKLWNFRSGKPVRNIEAHDGQVFSVDYSPNGNTLISASADRTIKLWDWRRGELLQTFEGHQDKVVSVAFAPDGKQFASASFDKTIKLWDVKTGRRVLNIAGHNAPVNAIAYSPDGKLLASSSQDQTVKIWDASTGKLLRTLSGHTGGVLTIAFNRDGSAIASGGVDKTIQIWDVKTGKTMQILSQHEAPVLSLSFSPKDATLVSGGADRLVKVWQLQAK